MSDANGSPARAEDPAATNPLPARDARLKDFLQDLSSGEGLPGSGAAGGIALALAAACAAKAAAITLKHSPANAPLREAREQLLSFMNQALEGSDRDTERFASFIHRRSAAAAEDVIAVDEGLLSLVDSVISILDALDSQVRRIVSGDIVAARALSTAARAIQVENIAEMRNTPAA